ncbi:MarR family transcriptional regulator [Bacillus pseudomycoides]|uniref:MarR family winged helix-turn-helix transcriptional regulator n=1 Tax=Bacillus pseudomycoides TaxID=64104 RepID=UPI0001A14A25|nr:MarR family transcriptional regulator [Bacillus pseudomycoides]EEM02403.1 Transcriptional regulator, MarR [Bacillus pseudomycoides]PGC34219.1 MarR family transcriptional regulator [Bacillus pseudomycoides]
MRYHLEDFCGFSIHRTGLGLKNYYKEILAPFDITPDQWAIMMILWEKDGITQKEIAEKVYRDETTVGRMIYNLEKKGFIQRLQDKKDRRFLRVYVTEKGIDIKSEVYSVNVESEKKVTQGLSEEELIFLNEILYKIFKNSM